LPEAATAVHQLITDQHPVGEDPLEGVQCFSYSDKNGYVDV